MGATTQLISEIAVKKTAIWNLLTRIIIYGTNNLECLLSSKKFV
jgi:hypothetical protein